jgi:hypothetical protein
VESGNSASTRRVDVCNDSQVARSGIFCKPIIDGRVFHRHGDDRMSSDIGHPLIPEVHRPIVAKALDVLLNGSQGHTRHLRAPCTLHAARQYQALNGLYNTRSRQPSTPHARQRPLRPYRQHSVLETNVTGCFLTSRAVGEQMIGPAAAALSSTLPPSWGCSGQRPRLSMRLATQRAKGPSSPMARIGRAGELKGVALFSHLPLRTT